MLRKTHEIGNGQIAGSHCRRHCILQLIPKVRHVASKPPCYAPCWLPKRSSASAQQCKRTKLRADITNRDSRQWLMRLHVPNLHNKAMRAIVLQSSLLIRQNFLGVDPYTVSYPDCRCRCLEKGIFPSREGGFLSGMESLIPKCS